MSSPTLEGEDYFKKLQDGYLLHSGSRCPATLSCELAGSSQQDIVSYLSQANTHQLQKGNLPLTAAGLDEVLNNKMIQNNPHTRLPANASASLFSRPDG